MKLSRDTVRKALGVGVVIGSALLISACASMTKPPLPTVPNVDLVRYQGPWYVIANIPLIFEKGVHNGVETYALNPDGTVATVFQFRKDAFDGEQKTIVGVGKVQPNTGNATWKVQVIWPFSGDYRIHHIEPDYSVAVIAQQSRDHAWVLARTPIMDDATLGKYRGMIERLGYDMSKFQRVPQNGQKP